MICIKRILRDKGRFLLLLAALVVAMLLLVMATQLHGQSILNEQTIENNCRTTALRQVLWHMETYDNGRSFAFRTVDANTIQTLNTQCNAILSINEGLFCSAVIPETQSLLPQDIASIRSMTHCERTAMFAVRINSIDIIEVNYAGTDFLENGETRTVYQEYYMITAEVVDTLALHHQLDPPSKVEIHGTWLNEAVEVPFEVGQEYIIMGTYDPKQPEYASLSIGPKGVIAKEKQQVIITGTQYLMLDQYAGIETILGLRNDLTMKTRNSSAPVAGKDGLLRIYAQQPEDYPLYVVPGDERADAMLDFVQTNINLLGVFAVDDLYTVPLFATQDAYISQGRAFTAAENEAGAKVCLISDTFARKNSLAVGQTIPIQFYDNFLLNDLSALGMSYYMSQLIPGQTPTAEGEYTIIGFYHAVEWQIGPFCFSPNTIFIPKGSMPCKGQAELRCIDSLSLKNGQETTFWEMVNDLGLPRELYKVYDNGYGDYSESLAAMKADSQFVFLACALLYIVILLAVLLLMLRSLKKDAAILRRIGSSRPYSRLYMLGCLVPIIALAALITYGLSKLIQAPLITAFGKLYTLEKPLLSTLTETTGLLSIEISNLPTLAGLGAALIAALVIASLLCCVGRERSLK